ncbi:MAG: hypothetical protein WCS42_18420 [Verrucomicrobiota bacterium]
MKTCGKIPGLILIGLAVILCLAARAQLTSYTEPPAPADSIVQLTAEAQGLSRVLPADWPRTGTYWLVMPGGGMAPMPCPPYDLTLPVFQIADGQFLIDATGGQVFVNARQAATMTAAAALDSQANALADFIGWIQETQLRRDVAASLGLDFPFPGDGGGGGGTNYFDSGYSAQVFTTNDLWLEITGTTNPGTGSGMTANLGIHSPWNVTNAVYDLFATTNLAPSAWQLLLRCDPGQTNLTVPNLATPDDFFILGLTNDADSDGLTDAYETLVSHTLSNNPDTDGDGIPDGWSVLLGFGNLSNVGNDPAQRANYGYTPAGWLNQITGIRSGTVGLDYEGNVTQASQ